MFGAKTEATQLVTILACLLLVVGCGPSTAPKAELHHPYAPTLSPQVGGVTVPVNGAPLTFSLRSIEADRYHVTLSSPNHAVDLEQSDPWIACPIGDWNLLAQDAVGDSIRVEVYAKNGGRWASYAPVSIAVCADPIDPYLVYRLIAPGYALWGKMGIFERSTQSYAERALITNRSTNKGCINCHTFADHSPERMMLHLRKEKAGTIIVDGKQSKKVKLKQGPMYAEGVYSSFHPAGRWIAYSVNDIRQYFPLTGKLATEVYDLKGDLVVYDPASEQIATNQAIFNPEHLYSMPEWSHDGRWLYFSRTKKPATERGTVRYDLCRIGFNEGVLADSVETIWAASAEGLSVGRMTAIPGGRWIITAAGTSGNFTVWHKEADLFLIDLQENRVRRIDEINSQWAESTPSASSSGGWVVFSSRRADQGVTTLPYITRFDTATGLFGKPYLLPQAEAGFYLHRVESFNLPTFVTGAVDRRVLLNAVD